MMVLVGLMLAVAPRLLVPRFGLQKSILGGLVIFASGLVGAGLAPTPRGFVGSIFAVSVGCVCIPAVQACLTNLVNPAERGALLGALGSLTELTGAIGSTLYAFVLALFTSDRAPLPLPGFHFFVGATVLVVAFAVATHGFSVHPKDASSLMSGADAQAE